MAGGYIPTPRQPAAIEAEFRRRCAVRADAITHFNYDIARWAATKIDDLLDEYLQRAGHDRPVT